MSTIFITEKPSVAQEYRKVLKVQSSTKTDGYIEGFSPVMKTDVIITWAVGHLIGICSPEEHNEAWGGKWNRDMLPMIPEKFRYKPQSSTAKQFGIVKSLYTRKDIDGIYYAGDSGREGIYIQALIRNQIFKSAPAFPEKVVWIDSFTEQAILDGIRNAKPYTDYQPMIDSGYARAISDWLIGMNFTVAFSLSANTLIKVGRVMTPTLAMIVNRQSEIDNFRKTDYYGLKADSLASWKAVQGSRYYDSPLLYNETGFLKKEVAENLMRECMQDRTLFVEDVRVQTKTEYAPYLFNLADLQAYCSKAFKISPAKTLEYAQNLYEKKYTTYPRTDCRFLSTAVADDLKKQGYNIPKRYVDDSKVTDHYAIIPTLQGDVNSLSGIEKQVYEAIEKRFMDTMKDPFIYDAVSVVYQHSCKEKFFESFRVVKQTGFKEKTDDEDIVSKPVPVKGSTVDVESFSVYDMETRPPSAYTTGSLILAMEKAGKLIEDEELREQIKTSGIGTSATRAGIIEKLEKDKLIEVDKKQKITPTAFGRQVIPVIEKFDSQLVSPVRTAEMENKLSAVAERKMQKDDYISEIESYVSDTAVSVIRNNTVKFQNTSSSGKVHQCPCCDNKLSYGKYGWYCSCGFSFGLEVCGHKMKESDLEDLIAKGKTKAYSFRAKSGKDFKASLIIDRSKEKGKTTFAFDDNSSASKKTHECPCCNRQLAFGRYGWNCECGFSFSLEICGHKMKETDLENLIAKGETKVYSFKSKSGNEFKAKLILDKSKEKGKTAFEFDNSGNGRKK